MSGHPLFTKRAQPVIDRGYTADCAEIAPVSRDQVGRPFPVACGQRMRDRLLSEPCFPVPGAGPLVQLRHVAVRGLNPGELAAQHLGEQVVVAVPRPVLVGWDKEQVLSLQPLDELGGVGAPGDRVTQRRGEPVKDGGLQQEPLDFGRLMIEYLFGQEVRDEPVVAGELIDEAMRQWMAPQRQCGQVHAGRPALCPREQGAHVRAAERDSRHHGHELPHLRAAEAELGHPDIGDLARGAQARQLERWRHPRHEDHLHRRRQLTEQAFNLRVTPAVAHQVIVIQNQDNRGRRGGEAGDEGREQCASLPGHENLGRIDIELRTGAAHRADHLPPQSTGIVVVGVEGGPDEPAAAPGLPLADQDGLS